MKGKDVKYYEVFEMNLISASPGDMGRILDEKFDILASNPVTPLRFDLLIGKPSYCKAIDKRNFEFLSVAPYDVKKVVSEKRGMYTVGPFSFAEGRAHFPAFVSEKITFS